MRYISFFIFSCLILLNQITYAQERYKDVLFDFVSIETYTYSTKDNEDLNLDIYIPTSDTVKKRTVYLFVHGGGFSGGSRDGGIIPEFCKNISRRGYVTVSMSYRLTRKDKSSRFGCDCPAKEKLETFQSAVEDIHDATVFLVKNRGKFGINPRMIILSGSSAGAEAVLNAAFEPWQPDDKPFKYAGVISFAGAIPNTNVITNKTAIPTFMFHGTCDNLVPYATAPHHYCDENSTGYITLSGSYSIANKLEQLNKSYWLHTTCGGNHSIAGTPLTEYFQEIIYFCNHFIIKETNEQIRTVIRGDQNNCKYPKYSFCEN